MSQFYTVSTTNPFAALDLSDDGDRILPVDKAPKKVEEVAPVTSVRKDTARNGGRQNNNNNRSRRDGKPAAPRDVVTPTATDEAPVEGTDDRNNRARKGTNHARRGGRNDNFAPREGQRTFDKHSNTKKAAEDTNPEHEAQDEAAAEQMAANEAEEIAVEEKKPIREPSPERFTVEQFLAQQEADRIKNAAATPLPTEYNDLDREIAEAGFKPLVKEVPIDGKMPSAPKVNKGKARDAMELFAVAGRVPRMPGRENDRNPRKNNDRKPKSASAATPAAEEDFPCLA